MYKKALQAGLRAIAVRVHKRNSFCITHTVLRIKKNT